MDRRQTTQRLLCKIPLLLANKKGEGQHQQITGNGTGRVDSSESGGKQATIRNLISRDSKVFFFLLLVVVVVVLLFLS